MSKYAFGSNLFGNCEGIFDGRLITATVEVSQRQWMLWLLNRPVDAGTTIELLPQGSVESRTEFLLTLACEQVDWSLDIRVNFFQEANSDTFIVKVVSTDNQDRRNEFLVSLSPSSFANSRLGRLLNQSGLIYRFHSNMEQAILLVPTRDKHPDALVDLVQLF